MQYVVIMPMLIYSNNSNNVEDVKHILTNSIYCSMSLNNGKYV